MSEIIEGVLAFAMAHPVATTIIAVAAIISNVSIFK